MPIGPFWIYRVYNDLGWLIYIGKTNNPMIRRDQHFADKAWAREARRWPIDLMEQYATEAEVLAAEAAAIRAERPLMNIEHNEGNPYRVNPHTMRYATGPHRGQLYRPELYADVHAGRWEPGAPRVYRRRPAAPPARRQGCRVTRRRGGRRSPLTGWLIGWFVLFGAFAQIMPGQAALVGSVSLLALGRLAVRKIIR